MKIEEGKFYETADGAIFGPMRWENDEWTDGDLSWHLKGGSFLSADLNLVREASASGSAQTGITLRDHFAGQALAGLCSTLAVGRGDPETVAQQRSVAAFRIADAMLAARGVDQ